MSRFAIIKDGKVANIAEAEADFAATQGWIDVGTAGIGWTYANGVFTAPPEPEVVAPPAPTKEQLMAELAALTAKIQALE